VDSDDALAPTAVEETAAVLDHEPSVGMVYTDHVMVDESGRLLGLGARCAIPYSKDRLLVDFMTFAFRLLRRGVYDAAGGVEESFATAHDYDFCLRVSEVAQIRHLARPLYAYRINRAGSPRPGVWSRSRGRGGRSSGPWCGGGWPGPRWWRSRSSAVHPPRPPG